MAHNDPHWITFGKIVDRWVGPGVPTDETLVNALIHDAEHVVLAKYPGIQARIDSGSLDVSLVELVLARMVMRVLRNPENLTYFQQTTGPFGSGKNYGSAPGNTDIWMSDEELGLLAVNRGRRAFSIDTAPNAIAWASDALLSGNGYEESE